MTEPSGPPSAGLCVGMAPGVHWIFTMRLYVRIIILSFLLVVCACHVQSPPTNVADDNFSDAKVDIFKPIDNEILIRSAFHKLANDYNSYIQKLPMTASYCKTAFSNENIQSFDKSSCRRETLDGDDHSFIDGWGFVLTSGIFYYVFSDGARISGIIEKQHDSDQYKLTLTGFSQSYHHP